MAISPFPVVVRCCWHFLRARRGRKPQVCRFRFRPPFPTVGHYWNHRGTLPMSLPWSNAVSSSLECWWYMSSFRSYQYLRLVSCHLGFSTRISVGHDYWTSRCFVHSYKPLYWFWNMCICKKSEVITTSSNLAAILDFSHTSTSHEIGNATARKPDPENIVVAVEIFMICVIVSEILLLPVSWLPSLIFDTR